MALNNMIRRVSTSNAVPLALRFASGSQRYHHQCSAIFSAVNRRSDLSGIIVRRSLPSALHRYSSLPVDNSLVSIIEEEIVCAKEAEGADKTPEAPPKDFPFRIEDTPSRTTITLSRNYQGEKITVEVGMTSLVTGEEGEDAGNQDDDNDLSLELAMVVRVARKKKSCLEFVCTVYADLISIDSLSLKDPDNFEEDELAYEGPEFSTLDEKLQKALLNYLEVRGIKPSTTNFLHEYMINKDSREYLLWLNNIKEFMES